MLTKITPIILTYNEEPNLDRTLRNLDWANDVIVIDSYSTDRTQEICGQYENVRMIQNEFISHSDQSNFALAQVVNSEWVLSMDADYIVTPQLKTELASLKTQENVNAYKINFKYVVLGSTLKGSLYPPRISLYRKQFAHYVQDGHTQRVEISGSVGQLKAVMLHDDRKPYSRWLSSQKKYARLEAIKLSQTAWQQLSWPDRVRVLGIAPLVVMPYTLLAKGLLLNGWPGIVYSWQRFMAELYLQFARFKSIK